MKPHTTLLALLLCAVTAMTATAVPLGSEFTYQGELQNNDAVANGPFDFEFRLFDAATGGTELAAPIVIDDLNVSEGLFSTLLDFGDASFSGERVWLDIAVREGASTGALTILTPRQEITSAPYALHAQFVAANSIGTLEIQNGSISAADINSSDVQRRVSSICPPGQSIRVINADGSVVCEVDDTGSGSGADGWLLGGNAGTSAGIDFLGTTDAEPLQLHVGGQQTLRLEVAEGAFNSPNLIAGWQGNQVDSGFGGSVVMGGSPFGINQASEDGATISGGYDHQISAPLGTISGGQEHDVDGAWGTVGGGRSHSVNSDYGTVAGGQSNTVTATATAGTVGGGEGNRARADYSVVAGGSFNNSAASGTFGAHSVIGGGTGNLATGEFSIVAGGRENTASSFHNVIAGGAFNSSDDLFSVISGGEMNQSSGDHSTVAGGEENTATGDHTSVSGGQDNTASGFWDTVGGGKDNQATGSLSVVAGGGDNLASGNGAAIPGGRNNVAGGSNSFAGGNGAVVRDSATTGTSSGDIGTFAWDGKTNFTPADMTSSGPGQFLVRTPGGAWFGTAEGVLTPDLSGAAMVIDATDSKPPLIARHDGSTVMALQSNGGLSVGTGSAAASNGLRVRGNGLIEGSAEIEGQLDLLSGLEVAGPTTINDALEVSGDSVLMGRLGLATTNPSAQLQVDAPENTDGLRVRIDGASKLWVFDNGGTSLGSATTPAPNGLRVAGNAQVVGTLSKGGGSFKIDHPLDPENQYLYHSFVESPDMMNIYNGTVTLDATGEARVELPDYFESLNRDFRYQLTAIGQPGPSLFIAREVQDNQFSIAGGAPGMRVSWQVTGVRQDPWAEKNRIEVEVDKPDAERGSYLHAEAWGVTDQTRSLNHAEDES